METITACEAVYTEQEIIHYQGNPLIEALPAVIEQPEAVSLLTCELPYSQAQRGLRAGVRTEYVNSLNQFYQPVEHSIAVWDSVSQCIRRGYIGRNPLSPSFGVQITSGYTAFRTDKNGYITSGRRNFSDTPGCTLIGISGIGKTAAVSRVLSAYPQIILHSAYKDKPLQLTQIVWMKLDVPKDDSIRGLCLAFLSELDRLLGTDYFNRYRSRTTVDALMLVMQHLAGLYCIGVLVIDELQHLSLSKSGGAQQVLNFLVTLQNRIGIPIYMIGTPKSLELLQGELRQARRSCGLDCIMWDRMRKDDPNWQIFIDSMWQYQWTSRNVPLTEEFRERLYHESQGITGIALLIYMAVQKDAIRSEKEIFTPDDMSAVVKKHISSTYPMLEAIRSGDPKKIMRFGDLFMPEKTGHSSSRKKQDSLSESQRALESLILSGLEREKASELVTEVLAASEKDMTAEEICDAVCIITADEQRS